MPKRIETWLEKKHPNFYSFLSFARKWRLLFVITVTFFYIKYDRQNCLILEQGKQLSIYGRQIDDLKISNAVLLAESQKNSKTINELLNPFWKKWYNPVEVSLIMITYNDAFYEHFLKDSNLDRFHYLGKTDFMVFPFEQADVFYQEDMSLVREFLNGDGSPIYKKYNNKFIEIDGTENRDGYIRWVMQIDGNIYVYGMLNNPKINHR